MIESFARGKKGKTAREIWVNDRSKGLPKEWHMRSKFLLQIMYVTRNMNDLKTKGEPPAIRLLTFHHPGLVLAEIHMKGRYTQTELAKKIGCQCRKINEIVNGKRSITPDFAIQLAIAIGTTPDIWIHMQAEYDLWVAKKKFQETA